MLFRWDINIRESAVLGLVGAGGIGVAFEAALNNLYWDQEGLILAVICAVVIVTEIVTSYVRDRIICQPDRNSGFYLDRRPFTGQLSTPAKGLGCMRTLTGM